MEFIAILIRGFFACVCLIMTLFCAKLTKISHYFMN